VIVGCVFLCVKNILPFRILLLEDWDGQVWKNHLQNCAPCHLPHVDGQVYPSLAIVLICLHFMLCEGSWGITTMLVCNCYSKGWRNCHFAQPFVKVPTSAPSLWFNHVWNQTPFIDYFITLCPIWSSIWLFNVSGILPNPRGWFVCMFSCVWLC
jgi:hypothetical protein